MTKSKYSLAIAGILVAGLLGTPLLASAAPGERGGPRADRAERGEMMRRHAERACADAPARLAGWLAFADTKLVISPAQRAAWDNFGRDLRASAEPLQAKCQQLPAVADAAKPGEPGAKPDPLVRVRAAEAATAANLESLKLQRGALEKLLPQLSAEQRTQFAELPPLPLRLPPPAPQHRMMHHTAH